MLIYERDYYQISNYVAPKLYYGLHCSIGSPSVKKVLTILFTCCHDVTYCMERITSLHQIKGYMDTYFHSNCIAIIFLARNFISISLLSVQDMEAGVNWRKHLKIKTNRELIQVLSSICP